VDLPTRGAPPGEGREWGGKSSELEEFQNSATKEKKKSKKKKLRGKTANLANKKTKNKN